MGRNPHSEETTEYCRECGHRQETGKHVLVAALSTFPYAKEEEESGKIRKVTRLYETFYDYVGVYDDIPEDATEKDQNPYETHHICGGYYQLEQMSSFIRKEIN